MGTSYSARVFFGTYAKRGTRAYAVLDAAIDDHFGLPADIEGVGGAEINVIGASMTGEVCNTIELKGVGATFDEYGGGPHSPVALSGDVEEIWILEAMRALGIASNEVAPIGWYFCGIAS